MQSHILGIDRWSKRIGLAYMVLATRTPLPLGYLDNSPVLYSDLASIILEYRIDTIVYGYPQGNKALMSKIDSFVTNLQFSVEDSIVFVPIDEHYSSVQASAITWDFATKDISQDTIAAMVILERWLETSS